MSGSRSRQSVASLPRPGPDLLDASVRRRLNGISSGAGRQRLSRHGPGRYDRCRGPLHPARRRPESARATLSSDDPRFALQTIQVETDDPSESKTLTAALAPPQDCQRARDVCRHGPAGPSCPAPGASASRGAARCRRIRDRRRRACPHQLLSGGPRIRSSWPFPRKDSRTSWPAGGVDWPKGALAETSNIALPRGVPVQGKVTEEGSGKPIAGAMVDFIPCAGLISQGSQRMSAHTESDGSFQLGAEPEAGHLFVRGPDDDYVLQAIGSGLVLRGRPGGEQDLLARPCRARL